MIIVEKHTSNQVKLEFNDIAFGLRCLVLNRNKQFRNSNMEGCYSLSELFEWRILLSMNLFYQMVYRALLTFLTNLLM
jgi:hypothetical protein